MKQKKTQNYYRPNFWGMMRDVLLASMSKGQFPLAIFSFVLIILILRLPSNETVVIFNKILDLFSNLSLLGWLLAVFFLIAWHISLKRQRKVHNNEVKRMAIEKKELQEILLDRKIETSQY
ncbi:MAG: hypothetical protein ACOCWM_03015 [Cyclobacteriaceae bacterium]